MAQKKRKKSPTGCRHNIWLPTKQTQIASEIENLSAFVQLALDHCVGIMQYAILNEKRPDLYPETDAKLEDVIDQFNEINPLPEIVKKRKEYADSQSGNSGDSSKEDSELWAA